MYSGARSRIRLKAMSISNHNNQSLNRVSSEEVSHARPPDVQHDSLTWLWAAVYIFSGISQPLIMTQAKQAGLANPSAQLYMFFYYLGPSLLIFSVLRPSSPPLPSAKTVIRASMIAVIDIFAQSLNYTGAGLAGPTVFSIIYSTVTIWTALFSRVLLHRFLSKWQWLAVFCVFCGLAITASHSATMGPDVVTGTTMVIIGSAMHGATYVLSEAIMTVSHELLTVRQNAAIQGSVACLALGVWQLVYTVPRFDQLILQTMGQAETSIYLASAIMIAFGVANLVHSVTFSHTLKYFPVEQPQQGWGKDFKLCWSFWRPI